MAPPDWLENVLKQEIETTGVPGLVAGYIDADNKPHVAASGIRQVGSDAPLQVTDAVHIGSCTKAVTALLIAAAVGDGQLRFTTTLGALDPIWKKSPWANRTIDSLLRHQGGLPENATWWELSSSGGELTSQRRNVLNPKWLSSGKVPSVGKFAYSNVGYVVLGSVIDKVYGMPYEDVVQLRIARPKLLQSVGFGVPSLARGHRETATGYFPTTLDNPPVMNSAGRLHLSVADWLQTATLHMASNDYLDSNIRRVLHGSHTDGGYAGGWIVLKRSWAAGTALTHAGSNTFWMATMWVAPNTGQAFAAVANGAGENISKGLDRIISAMIQRSSGITR